LKFILKVHAVSVYFWRKKKLFLAAPNSLCGKIGPYVAHGPGLSVAESESDEAIGRMVIDLREHSRTGIPTPDFRKGAEFPFSGIPGLTWGNLRSRSPLYMWVSLTSDNLRFELYIGEGRGYARDSDFEAIVLPLNATTAEIGASLRSVLVCDW
jgi:hypothetical protein